MIRKQLQFELWQECNSGCKFCYLGKNNNFTPKEVKLNALKAALEKINDSSIYTEYDTLAFIGGEFFQGQLADIEVKEAFMKLMKKTALLLNEGIIRAVWLYTTLTIGDQKDLYETLELFKNTKGEFWILTSYDTLGRFHTQKMEDNWKYHMKNIYKLYPYFKFNITTILSDDCITKYLDNKISFKKMSEEYHCTFFFKQCGLGDKTKEELALELPGFLVKREKFLKFLIKFKKEESEYMWTKLFNIKYRADVLYRNFNDNQIMQETKRNKLSKNEIETQNIKEMEINTCGHLKTYATYLDSDKCALCDKEFVHKMF